MEKLPEWGGKLYVKFRERRSFKLPPTFQFWMIIKVKFQFWMIIKLEPEVFLVKYFFVLRNKSVNKFVCILTLL